MARDEPILRVESLSKNFGEVRALRGIDFSLDETGVYGFLGPNGAGKTTTFKLISTLLSPSGGRVLIDGVDVREKTSQALRKVGIQFDSPVFYPYLSGMDNLRVAAYWQGGVRESRMRELMVMVGLEEAIGRKAGSYSQGMKQRLGIASALLADPELILMDEPTTGLDPAGIAYIRELLPSLARDHGCTVMLSSHRLDDVERICDHLIIIHRGEIAASGRTSELAGEKPIEKLFFEITGGGNDEI
jgi:ABC-type multidrug transport system ATPase subunit